MNFKNNDIARMVRVFPDGSKSLFSGRRAIFISHPCSGQTWLSNILDSYMSNVPVEFTHDILTGVFDDILTDKDVREIAQSIIAQEYADVSSRFIPTIILTRDPRDVLVSYYYQKQYREPWLVSVGKIGPDVLKGGFSGTIDEFVESEIYGIRRYVEFSKLCDGRTGALRITYEEMHLDIMEVLRKVLHHMNFSTVNEGDLQTAIDKHTFKEDQMRELCLCEYHYQDIGNKNTHKARKGKVGGYRDELPLKSLDLIKEVLNV